MSRRFEIDGSVYELVAACSHDSIAVYLDIHIEEQGKRVALLRLRCAATEPQYGSLERMSAEEQMDLAVRRGGLEDHVRSTLRWQSDLHKINPEWGISPIFQAWFPQNYKNAAHLSAR